MNDTGYILDAAGIDKLTADLKKLLSEQGQERRDALRICLTVEELLLKIMEANGSKGYGWSYVYIDSIKVEQTSTLTYGVKVDDSQNADDGWFSATDFTLDRLGDL